jgi:hypothetical protein
MDETQMLQHKRIKSAKNDLIRMCQMEIDMLEKKFIKIDAGEKKLLNEQKMLIEKKINTAIRLKSKPYSLRINNNMKKIEKEQQSIRRRLKYCWIRRKDTQNELKQKRKALANYEQIEVIGPKLGMAEFAVDYPNLIGSLYNDLIALNSRGGFRYRMSDLCNNVVKKMNEFERFINSKEFLELVNEIQFDKGFKSQKIIKINQRIFTKKMIDVFRPGTQLSCEYLIRMMPESKNRKYYIEIRPKKKFRDPHPYMIYKDVDHYLQSVVLDLLSENISFPFFILMSGDGDYYHLFEQLQKRNIPIILAAPTLDSLNRQLLGVIDLLIIISPTIEIYHKKQFANLIRTH